MPSAGCGPRPRARPAPSGLCSTGACRPARHVLVAATLGARLPGQSSTVGARCPRPGGRRSLVHHLRAVCDSAPRPPGAAGPRQQSRPRLAARLCPGPQPAAPGKGAPSWHPCSLRGRWASLWELPQAQSPSSVRPREATCPRALAGLQDGRLGPPGPVGTVCHAHAGGSARGDPALSGGGLPVDAGRSRSPFRLTLSLVGFIFRGALGWQTNLLERTDCLPPHFPKGLSFRAPEEPLSPLSLPCELGRGDPRPWLRRQEGGALGGRG